MTLVLGAILTKPGYTAGNQSVHHWPRTDQSGAGDAIL